LWWLVANIFHFLLFELFEELEWVVSIFFFFACFFFDHKVAPNPFA
jgi:hypothetical protein